MWKLILLLWLIPIAFGILLLSRISSGMPAFNRNERRLFFDERKPKELTPWLAIKFAVFALTFFVIGLLEGVILVNIPFVWMVLAALMTGGCATLLSVLWVRSDSHFPGIFRRLVLRTAQSLRLSRQNSKRSIPEQ